MKIGIVGFGALGSLIAQSILECNSSLLKIAGIYMRDFSKKSIAIEKYGLQVMDLETLLDASDCIIEATTVYAMPEIVRLAIQKEKPVIPMSVGGLAIDTSLLDLVLQNPTKIYIPSGGICGIDGLLALKEIGLDSVKITTTKSPRSLAGAPFLKENNIDVLSLTQAQSIYKGSARSAIVHFPSNVNVAITASCAGIGFDQTMIEIIADPIATKTKHVLEAVAGQCQITTEVIGTALEKNPKTSSIAYNSLKALLFKIASSLSVGT